MRLVTVLLFVTLGLAANPALAFITDAEGERYYVIKASSIGLDDEGDGDDATSIAFAFGQYIGDRGVAASETELGITVSNGTTTDNSFLGGGASAEWELMHLASFVSFRSPGDFAIKGKLGFAYNQLEVGSQSEQDFGAAYGIAGILGPVEVELTQLGSDLTQLSVGFRF